MNTEKLLESNKAPGRFPRLRRFGQAILDIMAAYGEVNMEIGKIYLEAGQAYMDFFDPEELTDLYRLDEE